VTGEDAAPSDQESEPDDEPCADDCDHPPPAVGIAEEI
jgi:hypothetical protein